MKAVFQQPKISRVVINPSRHPRRLQPMKAIGPNDLAPLLPSFNASAKAFFFGATIYFTMNWFSYRKARKEEEEPPKNED